MNSFSISVIIPVFNHVKYIGQAIESVQQQTYKPLEIIVVDDGSTDGSGEIAQGLFPNIKLFIQKNSGIGAARNLGISESSGEFLAFLDSDDIWLPNKLERQCFYIQQDSSIDMVFTMVEQFLSPELSFAEKQNKGCPNAPMPGMFAGTLLIRRSSWDRVGFFQNNLRVGEFIDWYARAQEVGLKEKLLPDVLHRRRVHSNNQGIRAKQFQKEYLFVLKEALNRRRAKPLIDKNN